MTTRERIKNIIDQLPDQELDIIEPILLNLLDKKKLILPKGNLGLKETFDRKELYDEFLAD